ALQIQNGLSITADTGRIGLDDAERERHRDRCVDDAATLLEYPAPSFRRERMRRNHDGARGADRWSDERLLRDHLIDEVLERCWRARLLGARAIIPAHRL